MLATTPGHLELVFGEIKGSNTQISNLVMNENYGKLMGEYDNEENDLESNLKATLRKEPVAQSSE